MHATDFFIITISFLKAPFIWYDLNDILMNDILMNLLRK